MEKYVSASVIIPTYNGASKISHLLTALTLQTVKDFDVTVVIDGSTDNTEEVLLPFHDKFRSFKAVKQKNAGRAAVRNRGVREVNSDILIFYDDDMIPYVDSVEKHLAFHAKINALLAGNPVESQDKCKTDFQNYRAYLSDKWMSRFSNGLNQMNTNNLFYTAANCSIPRTLFLQLDGFDERLNDGEDYDLACRALTNGFLVYFDKENKAVHNEHITCRSYVIRLRAYSAAQNKLQTLHPERSRTTSSPSLIKRYIYLIFASSLWIKAIDKGFFTFILPRRIRYRLYDIIIQAMSVEYPETRL